MKSTYVYETEKTKKTLFISHGKLSGCEFQNKLTGKTYERNGSEFRIFYYAKNEIKSFCAEEADVKEEKGIPVFSIKSGEIFWRVKVVHECDVISSVVRKRLYIWADKSVIIDRIVLDETRVNTGQFNWTIPIPKKRVYVPPVITTMGQPYYIGDMFFAGEFPMADSRITDGVGRCEYHLGRRLSELNDNSEYITIPFVIGSGFGDAFDKMRNSFFAYLRTLIRPSRFRIQFNSWYDNMLDIDDDKICTSFEKVADGFKSVGFRSLDCYVVDDGWTDYKRNAFWEFDKNKFPTEFSRESELTKCLGSTFGVWFGPRGGYSAQTPKYAKRLTKLGYHVCRRSHDICTGDPQYIADICDRMAEFCVKYNVSYFKIDGFAITPCKSASHGHPKGEGEGLYFYTFLWEEWLKGFERIRKVCPDVFLNITSYAHCSPYFLKWCDAVWLNNCSDMGYEGEGGNLDQCLNYRDGKYLDFFERRQLQFPVAYIYNHEPCYAERNRNTAPTKFSHKPVVYDYDEFERYLYMCLMRGTGFVELYFSPSMFDKERWRIAAKVLEWAEQNFEILNKSQYFGGEPSKGEVYGYYAYNGQKAFIAVRNPSNRERNYPLINYELSFDERDYEIKQFYPFQGEKVCCHAKIAHNIKLAPYELKIFELETSDITVAP